MFRGSLESTGYPLHSPVSPSLPLPASPCTITFQLESTTQSRRMWSNIHHQEHAVHYLGQETRPVQSTTQLLFRIPRSSLFLLAVNYSARLMWQHNARTNSVFKSTLHRLRATTHRVRAGFYFSILSSTWHYVLRFKWGKDTKKTQRQNQHEKWEFNSADYRLHSPITSSTFRIATSPSTPTPLR